MNKEEDMDEGIHIARDKACRRFSIIYPYGDLL